MEGLDCLPKGFRIQWVALGILGMFIRLGTEMPEKLGD